MIDREHALPIKRQANLVGISRGTANTADGDLFPLELLPMGAVPTTAA